jgi:hypothetical protein
MFPMVYSGARGKLIHEKNLKLKISCQTPFKKNSIIADLRTRTGVVFLSFLLFVTAIGL